MQYIPPEKIPAILSQPDVEAAIAKARQQLDEVIRTLEGLPDDAKAAMTSIAYETDGLECDAIMSAKKCARQIIDVQYAAGGGW